MPRVQYLAPGVRLDHNAWNRLWAIADAKLAEIYGGAPIAWWGQADGETDEATFFMKVFFWGGAIPGSPSTPGFKYLAALRDAQQAGSGGGFSQTFRKYQHQPFVDWVNQAQLDGLHPINGVDWRPITSDPYLCARLAAPTAGAQADALWAALWPEWPASPNLLPAEFLEFSLEAHTKLIGDKNYSVCVQPGTALQNLKLYTPVEVVIADGFGGSMVWPSNWNKFGFLRFNNLQQDSAVAVTMVQPNGSFLSFTVGVFGSQCVRRDGNGNWMLGYTYIFPFIKGDPWTLGTTKYCEQMLTYANVFGSNATARSNVMDPSFVAALLADLWAQGSVGSSDTRWTPHSKPLDTIVDPSRFWRTENYLCGKYYPAWGNSTPLGDFLFHKGTLVAVTTSPPYTPKPFQFTGMAGLASALAAVGITLTRSNPDAGNGDVAQLTASPEMDLVSLSSDFALSLMTPTGSYGVTVSSTPINLPRFIWPMFARRLDSISVSAGTPYTDINGQAQVTGSATNLWADSDAWSSPPPTAPPQFSLWSTVGDLLTYVAGLGGSLQTSGSIMMTIFGPVLKITQTIPDALGYDITLGGEDWWKADYHRTPAGFTRTCYAPLSRSLGASLGTEFWWPWHESVSSPAADPPVAYLPSPFGSGVDAVYTFRWPLFGSTRDAVSGITPPSQFLVNFPAFPRTWADARWKVIDLRTQPFQPETAGHSGLSNFYLTPAEAAQGIKQYYEPAPLPKPGRNVVPLYNVNTKYSAALLSRHQTNNDILTLFAAWVARGKLRWTDRQADGFGNAFLVYPVLDFGPTATWQAWYPANRSAIMGDPNADAVGNGSNNSLLITAWLYNTIGSVIDSVVGYGWDSTGLNINLDTIVPLASAV